MPSRPLPDSLLQRSDLWLGQKAQRISAEPTGHAALDALLPGGGWPRGAISEILLPRPGVGEWNLLLPALVRLSQAGRRIALVAPPHLPYAPALAGAGIALDRCWIVQPESAADGIWTIEQLLRSSALGAVVGWCEAADERVQRRLQLAAEQAGSGPLGLLLRPPSAHRQPSVSALRLGLRPEAGGPRIDILKARGGRSGHSLKLAGQAA